MKEFRVTIYSEKISVYPDQGNRWEKIPVYSHGQLEKNSADPADRRNRSPPDAKFARKGQDLFQILYRSQSVFTWGMNSIFHEFVVTFCFMANPAKSHWVGRSGLPSTEKRTPNKALD
jgi:hypothetical protein